MPASANWPDRTLINPTLTVSCAFAADGASSAAASAPNRTTDVGIFHPPACSIFSATVTAAIPEVNFVRARLRRVPGRPCCVGPAELRCRIVGGGPHARLADGRRSRHHLWPERPNSHISAASGVLFVRLDDCLERHAPPSGHRLHRPLVIGLVVTGGVGTGGTGRPRRHAAD